MKMKKVRMFNARVEENHNYVIKNRKNKSGKITMFNKKLNRLQVGYLCLSIALVILGYSCTTKLAFKGPDEAVVLKSEKSHGGGVQWEMQKVSDVDVSGAEISKTDFETKNWQPAIVPGTVLNSLVENGVYPEPYFGLNNKKEQELIPDIDTAGRDFYTYWFRTGFELPADFNKETVWLNFHGINYLAEVWLNGEKVGDMKGMFKREFFNVSSIIKTEGENVLAVKVEPVEHPGSSVGIRHWPGRGAVAENRNGGNGEIGQDVTMLMSIGWDFIFDDGIRDRNTGIWRDVTLTTTGPVALRYPFVKSDLEVPSLEKSAQTVSVDVINTTGEKQTGTLSGWIDEENIEFSKKVELEPNETKTVTFTPEEYSQLVINNPRVWWPVYKGSQELYNMKLVFVTSGKTISDSKDVQFGIRTITSDRNTSDDSRTFYVNGKRIFIRGSNYVPEAMLRQSKQRTKAQLLMTKQAGINLLRFWGGGISESDYFFSLCDSLGIMIWHEFWMTGDTYPPKDTATYYENVIETVKRIRNHPSLAYYVSSNEQESVINIKKYLDELDGTRGYQHQSECCGVHDGSPYKYENPMQYYDNTASNRGSRIDGFCPEYGTASLPPVECLREMMPEEDLWPINKEVWDYLDGDAFHNMTTKYNTAVEQYGPSESIEEYAWKGLMVGAVAYRGVWENWNYNKYDYGDRQASGILFWYHNSPVRQVCSRMWDWSLEPTAALYATQNALQPLHAQYDFLKNTVSVYNEYYKNFKSYEVSIDIYNMDMEKKYSKTEILDIPEDAVVNDIIDVELPEGLSPVHFIKLKLKDKTGELVSDAFYWRSTNEYEGPWTVSGPIHAGFEAIDDMPKSELDVEASRNGNFIKVTLNNPTESLAFFNRLKLMDTDDKLIRPVLYSDNYFSLLPGESKTVEIDLSLLTNKSQIRLVTEGWNTEKLEFNL